MSDDTGRRIALRQNQPHQYANGGGPVCAWCEGPAGLACHQQDAEYVEMTEDEMRDMIGHGQVTIGCQQCDYQAGGDGPPGMAQDLVEHMMAVHGMSEEEARDGLVNLTVAIHRCARCETRYLTEDEAKGALSRADGESYICSACGTEEALMQMAGRPLQAPADWPVQRITDPDRDARAAGWRAPDWQGQRSNRTLRPQPIPTPKELPDLRLHLLERWIDGGAFDQYARFVVGGTSTDEGEWERRTLRHASLWWIKDDMVDLVTAAAASIPEDVTAGEVDLPDEQVYGLAVLGKTWEGTDAENGGTCRVDAVAWGPSRVAGTPCLTFSFYRYLDFAGGLSSAELEQAAATGVIGDARRERIGHDQDGNPTDRLSGGGAWVWLGRADWPLTATLTDFGAIPAHPRDNAGRRQAMIEDRRWFASLCTLVNHRLSEAEPVYAARQTRRRAERAGVAKEAAPSLVRLIRLRQARHDPAADTEPGDARQVEWSHRWMVGAATGGTWAWRRCGPKRSERRLVYIAPYVKGPADKPLVLKENVRVWVK